MRIRIPGLACWVGASLSLLTGSASSASGDVPAPLMSAAQCMARILSATSGVTDVQIDVPEGKGEAYPILSYRFGDASGRRRFTELSLFEISGIDDAPYVFDRADIEGDPLAERLLPVWKARCGAGYGYITSYPR